MQSPFPAHRPAADDNFLIGCTSHDLTDDWSLASTVGLRISLTASTNFGALLGAFFYRQDYLTLMYRSTILTPIYLINLLWKVGLALGLDLKLNE